jgi:polyphenol oxidase
MDRRRFLTFLGSGAAAIAAAPSLRLWAQDYSKDYPVHCVPPLPIGTAKPVTLIKRSLLPRKSAFDLSAAELQRLRDAYSALRDLSLKDPHDPRGWQAQANVHCYYCSGGYDSLGTEIHGGWWFLPWHRCFLYMHERILGALIGYPDFRLPYWDWDSIPTSGAPRRTVPPGYAAPSFDVTKPTPLSLANSLFDRTRGATSADELPDNVVGKVAMKAVMCQTGENFTGGPAIESGGSGQAGQLEQSPHGPVHIWSGDPRTNPATQPAPFGCFYPADYPYDPQDSSSYPSDESQVIGCIDMGVLASAAQDPIFFAHHANIDRLWDIWTHIPQPNHTNPTDPNWLNQGWAFYDENKNWVFISVQQVLDEEKNLGYSYASPQVQGYTTTTAICGAGPAPKALAPAPGPPVQPLALVENPSGVTVGTKPHTQSIALPPEHRSGLQLLAAGTAQKRYELHIDGVSLPPNAGVIIRVFLDLPAANAKTAVDAKHFVGYISVVPTGPGHMHQTVRNVGFDLSPELAATAAASPQLSVTLVPVTAGGAEPLHGVVKYKRIYLTSK